ncbi:hypothetical protein Ethha_1679 [Ethanoligenens harbinense YUAN-3]|uniref:Uncharacterized protein n=1 Tax=Ethanoligenens harbinense (strain DSM 18485 / JCM 12961 / CGMCC 1.5033 / YUAN-3) TaxID=663278 RepID=E6U952_ETHHY|nr:hypothetical protein Ethha_1679 [Ethanoligenens harbinense YUAN-3]
MLEKQWERKLSYEEAMDCIVHLAIPEHNDFKDRLWLQLFFGTIFL